MSYTYTILENPKGVVLNYRGENSAAETVRALREIAAEPDFAELTFWIGIRDGVNVTITVAEAQWVAAEWRKVMEINTHFRGYMVVDDKLQQGLGRVFLAALGPHASRVALYPTREEAFAAAGVEIP